MDLLRRSNIGIYKDSCGELPILVESGTLNLTEASTSKDLSRTDNGPKPDASVVKVAMLSKTFQNRSSPSERYHDLRLGHPLSTTSATTSALFPQLNAIGGNWSSSSEHNVCCI